MSQIQTFGLLLEIYYYYYYIGTIDYYYRANSIYTIFFNIFEVCINFYCIKCEYLVPKWKDSFAKSVYIDDRAITITRPPITFYYIYCVL